MIRTIFCDPVQMTDMTVPSCIVACCAPLSTPPRASRLRSAPSIAVAAPQWRIHASRDPENALYISLLGRQSNESQGCGSGSATSVSLLRYGVFVNRNRYFSPIVPPDSGITHAVEYLCKANSVPLVDPFVATDSAPNPEMVTFELAAVTTAGDV